jgi:hypothetical protein
MQLQLGAGNCNEGGVQRIEQRRRRVQGNADISDAGNAYDDAKCVGRGGRGRGKGCGTKDGFKGDDFAWRENIREY